MGKLHYDSNDLDDGSIATCPHCGGDGVVKMNTIVPHDVHHYYYVECELCKASTYMWCDTVREAMERWNRRAK